MKHQNSMALWTLSVALCVLLVALRTAAQPSTVDSVAANRLVGNWLGSIEVGPVRLRLVVKITTSEDGSLTATMDSLDQGAKDLPIDTLTLADGKLEFEMKQIRGSYHGTLNGDGTELSGTWTQLGTSMPLTLKKTVEEITLRRPQEPQPPFPYDTVDVVVENSDADIKLAGTLTIPRDQRRVPAAILISGSGPQDRDETLLGHKPFWVLADYLTRRGIAVLRLDDRGVGGSTGELLNSTDEDLAVDALRAVAFLQSRKAIDPQRVGLIGHSEGGIIAPIAAARSDHVAFIVLMAGTGVTGEEILYLQQDLIAKSMGVSDESIERNRQLNQKIFTAIKQTPEGGIADKLKAMLDEHIASLPDDEQEKAEALKGITEANLKLVDTPWFRFFLRHDPRPVLRQVKCPVLAIIGEKDMQVPPDGNLREIEAALLAGGNNDVTVKELIGLNHLFQTCETGAISEYGSIEETFAPAALELIGNWVLERTSN